MPKIFVVMMLLLASVAGQAETPWWRQLRIGVLPPGKLNAITDVEGVAVGQVTLVEGKGCRTGVTAIIPHPDNVFQNKVPGAIYAANGFGKLTGSTQVDELGNIESPIMLTNTLSVPVAAAGVIEYTLRQPGNEKVRSVNALVGETNDGFLNDIRAGFVKVPHVLEALLNARPGPVDEGAIGAGTGTVCFGYKGGIGTASRHLPAELGGYKVGVLVQTNFGGILQVNGAPVGKALGRHYLREEMSNIHDGSCMIVVATDAPLNSRQLRRLARRAMHGLVRAGGVSTHGSGDYVIAFSTAPEIRYTYKAQGRSTSHAILRDDRLSPLFLAAAEATEQSIYHSLFAAESMTGFRGSVTALPGEKVRKILEKHRLLELRH